MKDSLVLESHTPEKSSFSPQDSEKLSVIFYEKVSLKVGGKVS